MAARIRKLLDEGYPVTESDGTLRPCRPEDIVILMRSPAPVCRLRRRPGRRDIPVLSGERDFFHTMEISVMLSLLRSWTTPAGRASDLRPPVTLFGFTADRLAEVRSAAPPGTTTTL
ncbi:MAG: hypothetical protein ACLSUM_01860 [Dysosmobacter welbionis]